MPLSGESVHISIGKRSERCEMIKSPHRSKERIYIYGTYGVGKSRCALSIAKQIEGRMFVIDNDQAYERMLDGNEFSGLTNVEVHQVWDKSDFEDYVQALNKFLSEATPDDWVVIDLLGDTWDAVQAYWTDQVYSKDIDEYFLDIKKRRTQAKGDDSVDRGYIEMDWVTIKKLYARRIMNQIVNAKCHFLGITGLKSVSGQDDTEVRREYSRFKGRPAGHKDMGHLFHTILFLDKKHDGWTFSTVKDRGREYVEDEPLEDFALDYLVKIGKWSYVKAGKVPKVSSAVEESE